MPSINEFKQAIRAGLQRNNRFRVMVDFPNFATGQDTARQASVLARTATTPESTLGVLELNYSGRQIPLPGDRQFNEWPVTFIGTQDWNIRDAFEVWQQNINGNESNSGLAAPEDYSRDILFEMLDANDNVTAAYILRDAWPVTVTGGEADSGAQDAFQEFNVAFRYTLWQKVGVSR